MDGHTTQTNEALLMNTKHFNAANASVSFTMITSEVREIGGGEFESFAVATAHITDGQVTANFVIDIEEDFAEPTDSTESDAPTVTTELMLTDSERSQILEQAMMLFLDRFEDDAIEFMHK